MKKLKKRGFSDPKSRGPTNSNSFKTSKLLFYVAFERHMILLFSKTILLASNGIHDLWFYSMCIQN